MSTFLQWLLLAAAIDNLVLSRPLRRTGRDGQCLVDRRLLLAVAVTTGVALVLAVPLGWLLEQGLLRAREWAHLRPLLFALVALVCVLLTRLLPGRRHAAGSDARVDVLSAANVVVLGAALTQSAMDTSSFTVVVAFGLGAAAGFGVALFALDAMAERLAGAHVPAAFAGAPIRLLAAGLFALGLAGFAGQ